MTRIPHDLHEMFPDQAEKIDALTASDKAFYHLVTKYNEINREIYEAETFEKPMDDAHLEALKMRRVELLDEIREALEKA